MALKRAVFTCVIGSQSLTKVCDSAVLQGNQGNVKSFCNSLLLETLHLLTLANQEVREMDPEIGRVMVSQCIERQLVWSRFEYLQHWSRSPWGRITLAQELKLQERSNFILLCQHCFNVFSDDGSSSFNIGIDTNLLKTRSFTSLHCLKIRLTNSLHFATVPLT